MAPVRPPREVPRAQALRPGALALLLALAAACGHVPIPWISHAYGWYELRSAHFLVDTDLDGGAAKKLVEKLEATHGLLVNGILGERREVPGRVRVIAPRDPARFRALAGNERVAGYYGRGLLGEPTIVLRVVGDKVDGEAMAHELAHRLSFVACPRQPRWFSEGLAIYFQTVAAGGRDQGWAGVATRSISEQLRTLPDVPLADVLAWRTPDDPGGYHLWSWLLFHYLADHLASDPDAYRRLLAPSADPEGGWRSVARALEGAPPEDVAAVQRDLDAYRRAGVFASHRLEGRPSTGFTRRELPSTDVQLLLVASRASWPDAATRDAALREAAESTLKRDPTHPVALAARAEVDGTSPVAALRTAVAARPDDWRAWFLLAGALGGDLDRPAQIAAYQRAVALNDEFAQAQSGLAWALALEGEPDTALSHALRGVELAPFDPSAQEALAFVEARLGECKRAVQVQRTAVAMASGDDAERAQARLEAYEQRCEDGKITTSAEGAAARRRPPHPRRPGRPGRRARHLASTRRRRGRQRREPMSSTT